MLRKKGQARERLREVGNARQGGNVRNLAAVERKLSSGGVSEGKGNLACKESKGEVEES